MVAWNALAACCCAEQQNAQRCCLAARQGASWEDPHGKSLRADIETSHFSPVITVIIIMQIIDIFRHAVPLCGHSEPLLSSRKEKIIWHLS